MKDSKQRTEQQVRGVSSLSFLSCVSPLLRTGPFVSHGRIKLELAKEEHRFIQKSSK